MAIAVVYGAIEIMSYVQNASFYANHSADIESEVRSISTTLPAFMGQAVNVDWTSSSISNISGSRGLLRKFSSTLTSVQTNPITIGVFLRETGRPSAANSRSDLRATALYFRRPSVNTPGELLISSSAQGYGNATLNSADPVLSFGSIVDFQISPAGQQTANGSAVRVAKIELTVRKYWSGNRGDWRWCPASRLKSITACQTKANFKDSQYVLSIPFYNNSITTNFNNSLGGKRQESLFGDLYFFRPLIQETK